MPANSVPGEDSFPGLETVFFLLCLHMMERERKKLSGGPILLTSSKPDESLKYQQIPSHWKLGLQYVNLGAHKHSVHGTHCGILRYKLVM